MCRTVTLLVAISTLASGVLCSGALCATSRLLSPAEESTAQYRLENLANELDLLAHNHPADRADVRRQEHQLKLAHAFEKIPFAEKLPELRAELTSSARANGVVFVGLTVLDRQISPLRVPSSLYSDQSRFHLRADDMAETLKIRVLAEGDSAAVERWAAHWQPSLRRYIDFPEGLADFRAFPDGLGHQTVDARIYRFRKIDYPTVRSRDPLALLPWSARSNLRQFSEEEPRLWGYVERVRELAPRASHLYATRGEFLVNDARMTFFLSKVNPDRVK